VRSVCSLLLYPPLIALRPRLFKVARIDWATGGSTFRAQDLVGGVLTLSRRVAALSLSLSLSLSQIFFVEGKVGFGDDRTTAAYIDDFCYVLVCGVPLVVLSMFRVGPSSIRFLTSKDIYSPGVLHSLQSRTTAGVFRAAFPA
jgi:hypothetical protein